MTTSPAVLVESLAALLLARGEWLAVAESCTGGWLAQELTAVAGSSQWFERGLVTYSNAAKRDLLGVGEETLAAHGAVSEATVAAMAQGLLQRAPVHWSVAISGVAGPAGGSPEKPVGTVCLAWAGKDWGCEVSTCHFSGNREAVRRQAVAHALQGLLARVGNAGVSA
ncbi:CinA family protein [Dechloromonas sp. ZY10]|uniref:CinA family protein n=1 Tax=Dechloromonas aquae TaxID=2664436 RepID=UPI00352765F0